MKQKNRLLYFSVVFTALALLSSLNFQMKIVAMSFLLIAVLTLDTQDGFILAIFSLCFFDNLIYSWLTGVMYFVIAFGLMLKSIFMYGQDKKLGKWSKAFVVLTSLYFVVLPIVKAIIFKHFSVDNYAYSLALMCLIVFVCYACNHINLKKLGQYLSIGVILSFGFAIIFNLTGLMDSVVAISKWSNVSINSLANADLIFGLTVVAQIIILSKIHNKQASVLDFGTICVLGIICVMSSPAIAIVLECLFVAVFVLGIINNREKLINYSLSLLIGVVVSTTIIAIVVNLKDWNLFSHFFKEIANTVVVGFDTIKGEFSTLPSLLFGKNISWNIDSLYISYIYNYGIVGVAICFVYLIWIIKNLFKNGSNKNYWGMVLAILLSTTVNCLASIVLLTVGVLSTADNIEQNVVDDKNIIHYGMYALIKRTFDITVSLVGIIVLFIPMIITALVIAIFSRIPPIVRIKRVGKDGKIFTLYKFRSMYVDAESRIEQYLTKEQLEVWKREIKVDNDPRITKVGRFIRKTSLDELPQLFNILLGDMSIIGNRPLTKMEFDTHFSADEQKLLNKMRPGLTGYWQVYGRSNVTFLSKERQKMYLHYSKCANLELDIKIFLKTFVVVLKHKGAK